MANHSFFLKLMQLYRQYKEVINYLIFGVISTIVNIAAYTICYEFLHISNFFSTVTAWILAVIVAYITNKLYVFEARNTSWKETLFEAATFFGFRLLSGIGDVAIMVFAVDWMHWNALVWKIISNVIVVILNYIFSKFFIFRKPEGKV